MLATFSAVFLVIDIVLLEIISLIVSHLCYADLLSVVFDSKSFVTRYLYCTYLLGTIFGAVDSSADFCSRGWAEEVSGLAIMFAATVSYYLLLPTWAKYHKVIRPIFSSQLHTINHGTLLYSGPEAHTIVPLL